MTGLIWGQRPMITRGVCRVTIGLAARHGCSAGRLLANPGWGLRCKSTMGTFCGEIAKRDLHPQIQLTFSPASSS